MFIVTDWSQNEPLPPPARPLCPSASPARLCRATRPAEAGIVNPGTRDSYSNRNGYGYTGMASEYVEADTVKCTYYNRLQLQYKS